MARPAKPVEIGKRYGSLVITSIAEEKEYRHQTKVNCICDCGNTCVKLYYDLKANKTKIGHSCGCKQKELLLQNSLKMQKHGHTSREKSHIYKAMYSSWCHMKKRCNNPQDDNYKNYGGRGIKVCPEWNEDFGNFLRDMGMRPPNTSLDRINNDGNYEPGNCRWASRKIQNNNQRKRDTVKELIRFWRFSLYYRTKEIRRG